jgi:peptidoglycan/LPS O-acetylase OafA/YrhL
MRLDEALKRYRGIGPGFHFLRHALSLVILAHHCRVAVFGITTETDATKGALFKAGAPAHLTHGQIVVELLRPGLFSLVGMFFALSGFLVIGSALRNPNVKVFFANRALRILPALSVEVILSVLVLGPMVTSIPLSAYFSSGQFFRYFGNIVGHVTFTLPGVFLKNPWPNMVNANLWTLPAEFWCYFFMLVLLVTGMVMRHKVLTVAIFSGLICALLLSAYDPFAFTIRADSTHYTPWFIVMMFMFGALFYINAKHVVLHPAVFALACAAYYLLTIFDVLGALSGLFLTYIMVYIGMTAFPWFDKLLRLDLSYGTYLYGFPITQAVIYFLLPHMPGLSPMARFAIILPLVIGITLLFSTLSWHFIEKPTLSLRKHIIREPPRVVPATAN